MVGGGKTAKYPISFRKLSRTEGRYDFFTEPLEKNRNVNFDQGIQFEFNIDNNPPIEQME